MPRSGGRRRWSAYLQDYKPSTHGVDLPARCGNHQHGNHGKPGQTLEGFTPDQRFFLGFAQAWRSKSREQALRNSLLTDVHAPGQFRALTVRNLDAWYPAFGVEQGQALYLAPDKRVKVW